MSDHDPSVARPSGPPKTPRARWIDALTLVLLLGAGLVAIAAAAPSLLRAAGVPLPDAGGDGVAKGIDLRHQPPEILGDPSKLLDPDRDVDPDDMPFGAQEGHGKLGLARGATLLRATPADGGKALGEIKAGELVMILKESGDWLQVWASGGEGVAMGWVKKSGIAVR